MKAENSKCDIEDQSGYTVCIEKGLPRYEVGPCLSGL